MHINKIILRNLACLCMLALAPALTRAELLTFQASDFGLTPTFSNVITFEFNGREVGTGRYHPALVQLNADGSGTIRNSNNFGGINPSSGMLVDVDIGEEYITEMTFTPTILTLIPPPLDLILKDGFEND